MNVEVLCLENLEIKSLVTDLILSEVLCVGAGNQTQRHECCNSQTSTHESLQGCLKAQTAIRLPLSDLAARAGGWTPRALELEIIPSLGKEGNPPSRYLRGFPIELLDERSNLPQVGDELCDAAPSGLLIRCSEQ